MKELSIEQKAKAYDKALERARNLHKDAIDMGENIRAKQCEIIFPELRESKDDRIMRVIRGWIYTRPASFFDNGISKEEILAWLEKQGEQKPVDSYCQENCKGFQETGKCFADGDCKAKREAESNDKNEPKFHEGDWVIDKQGIVHQIANVVENVTCHTYGYDIVGGGYFNDNTEGVRLWTIQDTKDGDVLCCESGWTCIFKTLNSDNISFSSYCFMDNTGWFCETGSESHTLEKAFIKAYNGEIYPATKEQRDLLFQKMKEAGYIFDFEKKELKKLGQSEVTKTSDQEEIAEISFGAKDSELQEATYYIPKGFHAEVDDDDKVVIKKGEKPTTWSEDDEHRVKDTIYFLDTAKKHYASTVELDACIDWLKSFKQRIGG